MYKMDTLKELVLNGNRKLGYHQHDTKPPDVLITTIPFRTLNKELVFLFTEKKKLAILLLVQLTAPIFKILKTIPETMKLIDNHLEIEEIPSLMPNIISYSHLKG